MNNNALVVFSGGQDSTTCLFWAIKKFDKVYALSFAYGQKHENEVEIARNIAAKAGVPFEVMHIPFIASLSKNSLTDSSMEMDQEKPANTPPNTFVPGRNLRLRVGRAYRQRPHLPAPLYGARQRDLCDGCGTSHHSAHR